MTDREFFERYMDNATTGYAIRCTAAGNPWTWPLCAENQYATLHPEAFRIALQGLLPSERVRFIEGYLDWQRSRPKRIWDGQEELNTYQNIVRALDSQFNYPNNSPLSIITAMSPEDLRERARELLAA